MHGMVIVDGTRRIRVTSIEHNACTARKTHINGTICYDVGDLVPVSNTA